MKPLDAQDLGNREAFRFIYERYYQPLCLFASRLVGKDDAEDVVDDVFLGVWKKQLRFDGENHLKSFLYLSTRNSCLNLIKGRSRSGERQHQFTLGLDEFEADHLYHLLEAEVLRELTEAVYGLPPQCQRVVQLAFFEGKSNLEIAEALNISVHTVKNQKRRGLDLLRGKLVIYHGLPAWLLPWLALFE